MNPSQMRRSPSGVPPGYRQQLAIYRALVGAMLARPVRTALVFTAEPRFLAMDEALPGIVVAGTRA